MVHGDNYGLIIPFSFAPIQIVILFSKQELKKDQLQSLLKILEQQQIRFIVDDNVYYTIGQKAIKYELQGIPFILKIF
jgi:glycyl-tRNA synthetase (class II)